MKLAVIGSGNMGGAIARGLAKGNIFKAEDITCTAHTDATLNKMLDADADFNVTHDNAAAVADADIIIIAVKPWKVEGIIKEMLPSMHPDRQIIVSVAAGIDCKTLLDMVGGTEKTAIFRVIPNTAIEVGSSMTFVSSLNATQEQTDLIMRMFDELGKTMLVEEKQLEAGTALASCGIAFAFRYIRAAMEGGVELGIRADDARDIVAYTVKGAADLLLEKKTHPESEIDKVTTPGGITIKGLNEMEHAGFTSSVIRGLKACCKK